MKTIKTVKLVRLSIIAALMSIGFAFTSCSPSDEIIEDTETVGEVVDAPETYTKQVFIIVGVDSWNGVREPNYNLVTVELDIETDEFVRIAGINRTHEQLKREVFNYNGDDLGLTGTHAFLLYNWRGQCEIPLMINLNYETPEFQLEVHLSQDIIDYLIERNNSPITEVDLRYINYIESLRDCYVMP